MLRQAGLPAPPLGLTTKEVLTCPIYSAVRFLNTRPDENLDQRIDVGLHFNVLQTFQTSHGGSSAGSPGGSSPASRPCYLPCPSGSSSVAQKSSLLFQPSLVPQLLTPHTPAPAITPKVRLIRSIHEFKERCTPPVISGTCFRLVRRMNR